MDPLEVMLNLKQVVPYYQPVISADTQLIAGYEVLPLFQEESGNLKQLDWFFDDSSIPEDFHLELNHNIQQKALNTFMENDQSMNLTFYYNARLLMKDGGESLLTLLQSHAGKGMDLNKIIIEIKEASITEQSNDLRKLIKYMKTLGIRIAIDVEQRNASLERLVQLEPNIVKADAGFLEDNLMPQLYGDVHHSLSMLSRKIGAALLFKGISTYSQLNYAWRHGGHYYQGSYLKQAQPHFVAANSSQEKIKSDFQRFVLFERKKIKAQLELTNWINEQFKIMLPSIKSNASYDDIILKIGKACTSFVFRVYICNADGIQLSSNAEKNIAGEWELQYEGKNKNWSWRPYFFENVMRMNVEKKGLLSDLYTDIERDERIRTYSFPISEKLYVFLDIPYAYLYEQEGLL
ncbi:EAL-associated domain-containing protein [Oceanobacillus sp. FSL K6-2867]|uniref:EAL domain-containing protein n=1 Tax=Oceanobacillus sp. FSL K6-2867 TaxID=2954748 RepID=UPI0030D78BE5